MKVSIVRGSVLDQTAEVVVNAANTRMRGGGGIDGVIHQNAGPKMLLALQRLATRGAEVAQPIVTPGFNLEAQWVVHVAGPIWRGGNDQESELLEECYRNALLAAEETGCRSVAFCSISTGAFGFPIELAAQIALKTLQENAEGLQNIQSITMALFGAQEYEAFCQAADFGN